MIVVAITGILGLVGAIVQTSVNDAAGDLLDGSITEAAFDDRSTPAQLIQVLQGVAQIAAGVLTVIWMYRIARNVRSVGRDTTFHPLFSIFGWALPPFLFVLPTLVLRELWKASTPDSTAGEGGKRSGDNPLLYVWFVLFGLAPAVVFLLTVGSVFDAALNTSGDSRVAAEAIDAGSNYTLVSGVLVIAAAAVWIVFAKQLTARHVALIGER